MKPRLDTQMKAQENLKVLLNLLLLKLDLKMIQQGLINYY